MNQYDLLLKGGRIIDPSRELDQISDIALLNTKIVKISTNINNNNATQVINCEGLLITPGLIDLHAHVYWGGTALSVDPKRVAEKTAVTTLVDAGSAGAGNFLGFAEHIIYPSAIQILAFLNISYAGIFGFSKRVMVGEGHVPELIHVDEAVDVAKCYQNLICGIKARACKNAAGNNGLQLIEKGLAAASRLDLPLMTHIGVPPPNYTEILSRLRPGDIITHAFRPKPNSALNELDEILPALHKARECGIYFDIGHGMGGFDFNVAKKMLAEGFYPDTISSDVHCLSIDGPAHDLLTTMSKLYALGMPLIDVIRASSVNAARILKRPGLATIDYDAKANLSIIELQSGEFNFRDANHQTMTASHRFVSKGAIRNGVYHEIR